jgi:hypothetical protein
MTSHPRSFGRTRPSDKGAHPIHVATSQATRDTHFRPLPDRSAKAPYVLDLKDVIPKDQYDTIVKKKKMTFHFNGDMGGINFAVPQQLVAKGMEADFDPAADASENPAFLYINGDCVYFNGQISQYRAQFYEPYEYYPAPIFAVPGNHDGENLATDATLDGFLRNFCADTPMKTEEAGDSHRTAMTQPNVFWTLKTPLANIVGLYSNVPEGGDVREPQLSWLTQQLKTLERNIPLLITLHHPVYSADMYHSGSVHMKKILEDAKQAAGRYPDMIIAGHVHDYQRITRHDGDARIPYLVTGAGGYHNLHTIQKVDGEKMVAPVDYTDKDGDKVTLERYSDDRFGFMRMEITPELITGRYYTVPRPQEPYTTPKQLLDYFEFDWKKKVYIPNHM